MYPRQKNHARFRSNVNINAIEISNCGVGNDVYTILNVYICSCVLFVDACIVLCFVDGINCYDECVTLCRLSGYLLMFKFNYLCLCSVMCCCFFKSFVAVSIVSLACHSFAKMDWWIGYYQYCLYLDSYLDLAFDFLRSDSFHQVLGAYEMMEHHVVLSVHLLRQATIVKLFISCCSAGVNKIELSSNKNICLPFQGPDCRANRQKCLPHYGYRN